MIPSLACTFRLGFEALSWLQIASRELSVPSGEEMILHRRTSFLKVPHRVSSNCSLMSRSLFVSASRICLVVGFDRQELDHLFFFSNNIHKWVIELVLLLLDVIKYVFGWMLTQLDF